MRSILGSSFAVGLAALGFGLGCGDQGAPEREGQALEERMQGAAEAVREEAEDFGEAAGELAEDAGEAAEGLAAEAGQAIDDATDEEDEEKAAE